MNFYLQGKLFEQTKSVLDTKTAVVAAVADAALLWTDYLSTGTKLLGAVYIIVMIMSTFESYRAKRNKRLNKK